MIRRRRGEIGFALLPALGLLLLGAGRAGAEPRLLDELAAEASVVALARVAGISPFADGALRVYRLEEVELLRGSPPAGWALLQDRAASPPLGRPGDTLFLLLTAAPGHSFFREQLPPGAYYLPVARGAGVFGVGTAQRALAEGVAGGGPRPEEENEWIRRELASGHSRFAADGVARLAGRKSLAREIGEDDLVAIRRCLESSTIGEEVRADLARLLGERRVGQAHRVLEAWDPQSGVLIAARMDALAALGVRPDPAKARVLLRSPDPEARRRGARELALTPSAEAVRQLAAVAMEDGERDVRIAAIESLAATGRADAVPVLERTFNSTEPEIRIASARAFHELGGPAARSSLTELVLYGDDYDAQRYALILLFAQGVGRDDPEIERIRREHPDDRIRELIDHGMEQTPH